MATSHQDRPCNPYFRRAPAPRRVPRFHRPNHKAYFPLIPEKSHDTTIVLSTSAPEFHLTSATSPSSPDLCPRFPAMASRVGPRSVKDATRFTSTIPHATSKAATASTAGAPSSPAAKAAAKTASQRAARLPGETPEQRVRRLRQAHLAAQQAQISTSDRLIDGSRRVLNVVHRFTVTGVVIFTGTSWLPSMRLSFWKKAPQASMCSC